MKSLRSTLLSLCAGTILVGLAVLCLSQQSHSTPSASSTTSSAFVPGAQYAMGSSVVLPATVQRLKITAGYPISSTIPNTYQTQTTSYVPETIAIATDDLAAVFQNAPCITTWSMPAGSPALAFRANPLAESDFDVLPGADAGLVSYFTDHEPIGDRHYGVSYPNQTRKTPEPGDMIGFMSAANDRIELSIVPGSSDSQIVADIQEDGSVLFFAAEVP